MRVAVLGETRRLDFDKDWDCPDDLSEIAIAVFESSFNPFPKAGP